MLLRCLWVCCLRLEIYWQLGLDVFDIVQGDRILVRTLFLTAALAYPITSGWLVLKIWKPGRLKHVRWVFEINSMSILLFCTVASSSFMCLIRPFQFQVRMRRDINVVRLVDNFGFNKGWEDCSEEGNERIYNWFKFIKKCKEWYSFIVFRRTIWVERLVTLSYISMRTWVFGVFHGMLLMIVFRINIWLWRHRLLMYFTYDVICMA